MGVVILSVFVEKGKHFVVNALKSSTLCSVKSGGLKFGLRSPAYISQPLRTTERKNPARGALLEG